MNTLRIGGLALAIVASVMLLSGTFGATSTAAERDVSVSVVDDQDAFVGYEAMNRSGVEADHQITVIKVENRFEQPIDVTDIELKSGHNVSLDVPEEELPTDITPGNGPWIMAEVDNCTPSATETVSVRVTVEGDGLVLTLSDGGETVERSFEVSCAVESENQTTKK